MVSILQVEAILSGYQDGAAAPWQINFSWYLERGSKRVLWGQAAEDFGTISLDIIAGLLARFCAGIAIAHGQSDMHLSVATQGRMPQLVAIRGQMQDRFHTHLGSIDPKLQCQTEWANQ